MTEATMRERSSRRYAPEVRWSVSQMFWFPESVFVSSLGELGARHMRHETFAVDRDHVDLDDLGDTLVARRHVRGETTVLQVNDGVALIEVGRGSATVEIACVDHEGVDRIFEVLSERLGAAQERENEVPVTFWALGHNGAKSAQRRIAAPSWSEIASNYAHDSGLAVAKLMTARVPEAGRLVLWHGEPGTGKTHALRALGRAWTDWCSTHFITDPEAFLGSGTSYLLDVLTSGDGRDAAENARWKLVVLEDAGELLSADAHERTGQALSRLLNVTDGVLGQGMKTIVLVTTNEPLGKIHPAIQRSGRCWREIDFAPLDVSSANRWLARHDSDIHVGIATPLADLFAIVRGRDVKKEVPFGFGAA
jgi:hypothetical protein